MTTQRSSRFPTGVALVIGGSGGMGSVICETLAAHGSDIALTYRNNRVRAEEVAAQVRGIGRNATIHGLDIADEAGVGMAVAEIVARQRIHTVVVASGSDITQLRIGDLAQPRGAR